MDPEEALRVVQEVSRRADLRRKIDFGELSFAGQREFIEDDSRFVAGLCGRRAGKSDGAVLKALRAATDHPGTIVPYIALSRPHAKRIVWPKLLFWNRRLELDAKFNHAELTMTLPRSGSVVSLGGANDDSEIERYRGGAYPLVVLDEAQAFRSFIEQFVIEILLPATIDYEGQICLIGTPNQACFGYFHDATTGCLTTEDGGSMFSVHKWTGFDNPNIDDKYRKTEHGDVNRALQEASSRLMQTARAAGLSENHPVFKREYLGQWVRDAEGLVYEVRDMNVLPSLPDASDWRYVLGMDVGFVDATAYVVMAYSRRLGKCAVVESFQESRLLQAQQVAHVDRLSERYRFEAIVVDPGGGGKQLVEELYQRHGLPAQPAEKQAKVAAIGTVNSDLRSGSCVIVKPTNQDLLWDLRQLKWNYAKLRRSGGSLWRQRPISALEIDDRTPDHLADAFLYAHRCCAHYLHEFEETAELHPGSAAWARAQEQEILEKLLKRASGADVDEPWWASAPRPRGR